ncbi:MAG: MoxR family ATPase [Bacillota bacterium]|nr:MoxR family ATPase [Bacillota bacterium]
MNSEIKKILDEIQRVIVGKQEIIEKILMAILCNGHVLIDDVPGVGKTTMAVAVSRALGLDFKRIQFTPDVLPSDIVGFSMYQKHTGQFEYMPGIVNDANILLGDEINRTSSKTQSALLEAMEEKQITVDGCTHRLKEPFIVIATQNQVGTAGTQPLPYAQLDRFLIKLTMGYPDIESQKSIIRDRQTVNPLDGVAQISDCQKVLAMQEAVVKVTVKDDIISYITELAVATRENAVIEFGVSPRGALAVCRMAKARAYVYGRNYVIPDDVISIFPDVCAHRILLNQQGKMQRFAPQEVLLGILQYVPVPKALTK